MTNEGKTETSAGSPWAGGARRPAGPAKVLAAKALAAGVVAVAALGGAAAAGPAGDAGDGNPPPAGSKTVFITSQMFDGKLGGLAGADEKCTEAARAAGLSGTFRAWLSDGKIGPADRFARSTIPYVRTDGVRVADDWNDLVTCDEGPAKKHCLDAPIKVDESGTLLGGFLLQGWSNTQTDGTPGTPAMGAVVNCADWTSNERVVEAMGATGQARLMGVDQLDLDWTGFSGLSGCYVPNHLFCFEQ